MNKNIKVLLLVIALLNCVLGVLSVCLVKENIIQNLGLLGIINIGVGCVLLFKLFWEGDIDE